MSFFFLADGSKTYQSWDEKQRINLEQPKYMLYQQIQTAIQTDRQIVYA